MLIRTIEVLTRNVFLVPQELPHIYKNLKKWNFDNIFSKQGYQMNLSLKIMLEGCQEQRN